jgi:pyruvate, water dikinase
VSPVPLPDIDDEPRFGGKAVQLGAALRAGLPVPYGVGLDVDIVGAVAAGDDSAAARCHAALATLSAAAFAVRSSAVGEDSAHASFAGQHLTRLNVTGGDALVAAITDVWRSGRTAAALAYRARLGVDGEPRVGVVIQEMIDAECAGVLFTRNPLDGRDERVIEAAWGLGEAVVGGLVEPDRYHLARGGALRERVVGDKDMEVRLRAGGDTEELPVEPQRRRAPCLDDARLALLESLAARCEACFAGAHDIEWAFADGRLYLLQRRAVTR